MQEKHRVNQIEKSKHKVTLLNLTTLIQMSKVQKAWQEFENNWKPSPWAPSPENTSKPQKKYTDNIELPMLKIKVAKGNIKLRSETPDYQKAISFFEKAQPANFSELEQFLFKSQIGLLQLDREKEWEV